MKKSILALALLPCLLLSACKAADASAATTTSTTEAPAPIEYHDKYVDLKSGERLYYRYEYLSTALWRQYVTDLDACMNSYQLFAKVKLEAVRLDAFLEPNTITGYYNGAMAYDIQIQEIYRQDDTWTDAMTDEVNNGLVYSHIDGYVDGNNEEQFPRITIYTMDVAMLLEDTEYYVGIEEFEGYMIAVPIGEVEHPFMNQSPLMTAWGDQVEVSVTINQPPEMWAINSENLAWPNIVPCTRQFQAYIRYTLKDEEYYQKIKNKYPETYEYALELLNNRPAQ